MPTLLVVSTTTLAMAACSLAMGATLLLGGSGAWSIDNWPSGARRAVASGSTTSDRAPLWLSRLGPCYQLAHAPEKAARALGPSPISAPCSMQPVTRSLNEPLWGKESCGGGETSPSCGTFGMVIAGGGGAGGGGGKMFGRTDEKACA
jgi:hypothetical protein